ncbi:hypothetical protein CDEF62S_00892 [Castellaniella defragrans]
MATTLVWESAGAGYAVAPRRPARRRARVSPAALPAAALSCAAPASPAPQAWRRPQRRPVPWGLLATRLGEILAVALWAALIPVMMWLGTAAGF